MVIPLNEAAALLTAGAITKILNDEDVKRPVLQVLGYKKMSDDERGQARYRFILSDGENTHQACMLMGNNHAERVERGEFERFTIVRLDSFSATLVSNGHKAIIMTQPVVLHSGAKVARKIGNATTGPKTDSTPNKRPAPGSNGSGDSGPSRAKTQNRNPSLQEARPIDSLNEFQPRGNVIKGRVVSKSQKRTWNNQRGEGQLFSFDVRDSTGHVKVTAFNQQVDEFYDRVEEGKVYLITQCTVKLANKRFTDANYEISLSDDAQIIPVDEDHSCPQIKFNFVRLADLEGVAPDTNVDVAVVARSIGQVQNLTSKKTGKELFKRDLKVVDESGAETNLTLWGEDAKNFTGGDGCVLLVRNARVSDFGGKTLSTGAGFSMQVDPLENQVAASLKQWFSNSDGNFRQLAVDMPGRENIVKPLFQLLAEAQRRRNGAIWGAVSIWIMRTLRVSSFDSCNSCGKKVLDMNNGSFRCDNCSTEESSCKKRYLQAFVIADSSENYVVTFFDKELRKVTGLDDEGKYQDTFQNKDELDEFEYENVVFHPFQVRLRLSEDYYKDQQRMRATAIEVKPLNWIEESRRLLAVQRHFSRMDLNARK